MNLKIFSAVLIALGTTTLATAASAANADAGFYIGGQAGYGKADYGLSGYGANTDDSGFAGRPYVGYQFNQYFGVETGYTFFSDSNYSASGTDFLGNPANAKASIQTNQWDILAKAGMPFGDSGFRGDIKAGAAYVMSKGDFSVNYPAIIGNVSTSGTNNKWEPIAGASVAYNLNQNFALDVSYLHTFGSGDKFDAPDTDLVTLGVSYRFA